MYYSKNLQSAVHFNVYSNFLLDHTSVQTYGKFYVQTLPLFA